MTVRTVDRLQAAGEIGGRTVQIVEDGTVECATYPVAPLPVGTVRIRTVRSTISPGTEMTFYGHHATNVMLRRRWNPDLRIFQVGGEATLDHPVTFGYRAAGEVVESRSDLVAVGMRVWGSWRHTEFTSMSAEVATNQRIPDGIGWGDACDIAQMGPIAVNAGLTAGSESQGRPVVVFGAGPIGLITAQVARAFGASGVQVIDRIPERLAIARDLGLDVLPADPATDLAATLKTSLGADGIPVAFECSGSLGALHEATRVVERRGLVVAVGFYQGGAEQLRLGDEFHHNAVRIVAAQIGNPVEGWDRPRLQRRTLGLLRSGDLVLGGLPRLVLPVEAIADGFAALSRPAEVLQVTLTY